MKLKIIFSLVIITCVFIVIFFLNKNTNSSKDDLGIIYGNAKISNDKKSILDENGKEILSININNFFDFYKEIVCREYSVLNIEGYCSDNILKEKLGKSLSNATFLEIKQANDNRKIAFKIHIPKLDLEKPLIGQADYEEALGLFNLNKNKLMLLGEYTGQLLDFSPNGKYIAYVPGCLEGECDIFIADTENLKKFQVLLLNHQAMEKLGI